MPHNASAKDTPHEKSAAISNATSLSISTEPSKTPQTTKLGNRRRITYRDSHEKVEGFENKYEEFCIIFG
jgi:hypothetical protein